MLPLKEFFSTFALVTHEFRIINEHFEMHARSTLEEYESVFFRWRQDIQRRFREVSITHRWATRHPLLIDNILFFIVRYGITYNCEVKYLFTPQFRREFSMNLQNALDTLEETIFRFQLFVLTYKVQYETVEKDTWEKEFLEWKKTLYKTADVYAVDFIWVNEGEEAGKSVELTLSQKDNFVILVRYDLDNPPPLIKEIQVEQDIL